MTEKKTGHPDAPAAAPQDALQQVEQRISECRDACRRDSRRALSLAREAFELARSVDYRRGMGVANFLCGWAHMNLADNAAAQRDIEQSLRLLEPADELDWLRARRMLGLIFMRQSRFAESLEVLLLTQEYAAELGMTWWKALLEQDIGGLMAHVGDFKAAFDHLSHSLPIIEGGDELHFVQIGYSQLGAVCGLMGDYARAEAYLLKGLATVSESCDRHAETLLLNNLSYALVQMGAHDRALEYLQRASQLQAELGDEYTWACTLHNIGVEYMRLGEQGRADETFTEALEVARRIGCRQAEVETLVSLGELRLLQGRTTEAQERLELALRLATEAGLRPFVASAHRHLADLFTRMGSSELALQHFRTYHEVDREVASVEAERAARGLEQRLELERVRRDREVHQLRTVELGRALSEVESLNEEMRGANRRLEALHREREQLLSVISHDLRNPVMAISIAAELLRMYVEPMLVRGSRRDVMASERQEGVLEQLDTIERSAQHMSELIGSLRRARTGWTVKLDVVALSPLVRRVMDGFLGRAGLRDVRLRLEAWQPSVHALVDAEATAKVLFELLSNALRFSPPGRAILVRVSADGVHAWIEVRDQGPGLSAEARDRYFVKAAPDRPGNGSGSRQTGDGTITALTGLSIAQELAEAMEGQLSCDSVPGRGASFRLTLLQAQPVGAGGMQDCTAEGPVSAALADCADAEARPPGDAGPSGPGPKRSKRKHESPS